MSQLDFRLAKRFLEWFNSGMSEEEAFSQSKKYGYGLLFVQGAYETFSRIYEGHGRGLTTKEIVSYAGASSYAVRACLRARGLEENTSLPERRRNEWERRIRELSGIKDITNASYSDSDARAAQEMDTTMLLTYLRVLKNHATSPAMTKSRVRDINDFIEPASLEDPEIMGQLRPKERFVLELYSGLFDGITYRLDEIAALTGVTRERVRQIKEKALARARWRARKRLENSG